MKLSILLVVMVGFVLVLSCGPTARVAPVAETIPHTLEAHGDVRVNDYYWLRARTDPEVLAYLEAENDYTAAVMAATGSLQAELFEELKNRLQPDESTVPARYHGYYYLRRYEEGLEYPIHSRRQGSVDAPEEVILDVNRVAAGHDFCSVRGVEVSPDSTLLSWALDTVGRRKYTIRVTDLASGERTLMKREQVRGGFDPDNYTVERLWAPARDGVEVPISLVYRAGIQRDGGNPTLLYAYGSYGSSMEARFRPEVLSLLDRGFVSAVAHVRGGEELGRWWYEDGKLLKKKNTFTDFIDCGRFLVAEGYTSPERLFARGGSAGGLLMGAVANMAPELFAGIIANVPWVDVITTMLDDTIPLTTAEFDEWGDPRNREYYDYMLSYSPYDNVTAKDYPALLVTTALEDSQVQYFEPAKWVAKLRATKTDDNPLLLKCEMAAAGHGGVSGRYKRYDETALEYAFMLGVIDGVL